MSLSDLQDSTAQTNEPVALDAQVDYDCTPWENVDTTVFLPPSTIRFENLESLLETGMEYGTVYESGAELPY